MKEEEENGKEPLHQVLMPSRRRWMDGDAISRSIDSFVSKLLP